MRERGRRLGIDVGSVRIGIAICDPDGLIATPLVTLPVQGAVKGVIELVGEYEIVECVVGLPKHLGGEEGTSAIMAREFGSALEQETSVPVTYIDERLSTKGSSRQLSQVGVSTREQKGIIDQLAAAAILQLHLDSTR